jgi:murein DD-endopeptidase MepM/ murein hydrolase activator NlpD
MLGINLQSFAAFDCSINSIDKNGPVLCGNDSDGGVLFGETDWNVTSNDITVLNNDGLFVVGLPMEFGKVLKLKFCKDKNCKEYSYKIKSRKYNKQKVYVDDEFINYTPEIQKRIDLENAKIMDTVGQTEFSFANFMNMKFPFPKRYRISSNYGNRRVFNEIPKSPHRGIDIAAPAGTSVHSVGDGKVVLAMNGFLTGNTVLVSHGFGFFSAYFHLSKIMVNPGDIVSSKTLIGKVGSTGRSSGPHLHLGLYFEKTPLDPAMFF